MEKSLPKISIITPSYNQGQFIEETIKSVLSQNYPNLEYIIMDGGSTDGTIDILKKYKKEIIWFSQKDRGQSHALNKGLKIATGEIIGYINSDDYYEQKCFIKVARYFLNHKNTFWLIGKCNIIDDKNNKVRYLITLYKNLFLKFLRHRTLFHIVQFISQPATFFRSEVVKNVGFFDESLHYDMDYDYWLRIWEKYSLSFLNEYLASYRLHYQSKAVKSPETQFNVEYEIITRYSNSKIVLALHRLHAFIAVKSYKFFSLSK